ncbi:polymeric immunoglobulin receptor-like isoform X2 [Hemibagrus wyckioides]|uniref:polymeric immunoglobulin receptor-like isoform X2 n=1 Tax=Hemibagrus wyckioides TaxID=337641 RepID=UPI00266CED0B|nr:polymeric immunoglobulin receptor-like isoform X2 [Hemibagrus wyckioides]
MSFYSLCGSVTLLGLFLCLSEVESMRTLKNVAVKSGGSVTIPCSYEGQYKANPKFWCEGYYWHSCSIVAYANSSGSTSVIDHPAQNLFTVELNKVSESGTYWCAAEIADKWQPDDRDYLYLTISQDLSVRENRVRGEEGGSVTVQCLYSAAYQNTQKQWCRFKDKKCWTFTKTETSQNSAVQFSDNGNRSFSVMMSGLKKSDTGWYWCSAGDLEVPVHISVGGDTSGLNENHTEDSTPFDTLLTLCIISGLLLVLMVVGLVIWKHKRKHTANKGHSHSLGSSVSEPDVTYSSVTISQPPMVSAVPPDNSVIYSSVKHQ